MPRRKVKWPAWQQKTFQQYVAQGLSSHIAWPLAKAETAARQRLARVIGIASARSARLELVDGGDELSLALVMPLSMATEDQAAKLKLKAAIL